MPVRRHPTPGGFVEDDDSPSDDLDLHDIRRDLKQLSAFGSRFETSQNADLSEEDKRRAGEERIQNWRSVAEAKGPALVYLPNDRSSSADTPRQRTDDDDTFLAGSYDTPSLSALNYVDDFDDTFLELLKKAEEVDGTRVAGETNDEKTSKRTRHVLVKLAKHLTHLNFFWNLLFRLPRAVEAGTPRCVLPLGVEQFGSFRREE
jgi:hypothetical protein